VKTFYRENKEDVNEELQEEGGLYEDEKVIREIKSWFDKIEKI